MPLAFVFCIRHCFTLLCFHTKITLFFYEHVRPELLTWSCFEAEHFKCRSSASLSTKVFFWEVLERSFWNALLRRVTMVKADLWNDNNIFN